MRILNSEPQLHPKEASISFDDHARKRLLRESGSALHPFSDSRRKLRHPSKRGQERSMASKATYADEMPLPYIEQQYTPERNEQYWSLRPVTIMKRTIQIGLAFSGWFLQTRLWSRNPADIGGGQAERLREILTDLGPAFVKIGQAVSSRPDFVPPSYSRELEKLQDRIPPYSDEEAMQILEEELGRPVAQVFSEFSRSSIAAASLGQVYKARVRATGRTVAVKVQRPNVRESIALDIFIMRYLVGRFGLLRKLNSDLPSLLDEWAGSLFRELDYRREAQNGTKFKELYAHLEGVYIPEMVPELTTQRVLTMEWVDGVRLRSAGEDISEGQALNPEDMRLVGYGVQCSLEQMLEDGFYHADPHPGNLLRTDNGRLGYLDFGMMASIEPKIRRGLIRATLHMVNREFQALANDFEILGLLPPGSEKQKVVPALSSVFERALAGGVSNMSFSTLSRELGRTMYDFKFRIPSYYTLLVRSLSVLEGIALSSDPNYKVLGAAYPWIARRLLTDSNPELQDTLRVLLYKGNSFQFSRLESLLQQALKSPARLSRIQPTAPPRNPTQPGPSKAWGNRFATRQPQTNNPSQMRQQPPVVEPTQMEKPLELLLGEGGSYVRSILVDELAKGVDAAWRMSADSAVQDLRSRLNAFLQSPRQREARTYASQQESALPAALLTTLESFPALADRSDTEQVEGINSLVRVLQEVRDKNPAQAPRRSSMPSVLPGQVQEAINMLQWFVREVQTLSPYARNEALRLPLSVGGKLSSRIAARAVKAFLNSGQSNSGRGRAVRSAVVTQQSANAPATRLVNGSLRPASPPPSQPLVALGTSGTGQSSSISTAEQAISRPPGSQSRPGLSSEGGGLVTPPKSKPGGQLRPSSIVGGGSLTATPELKPTKQANPVLSSPDEATVTPANQPSSSRGKLVLSPEGGKLSTEPTTAKQLSSSQSKLVSSPKDGALPTESTEAKQQSPSQVKLVSSSEDGGLPTAPTPVIQPSSSQGKLVSSSKDGELPIEPKQTPGRRSQAPKKTFGSQPKIYMGQPRKVPVPRKTFGSLPKKAATPQRDSSKTPASSSSPSSLPKEMDTASADETSGSAQMRRAPGQGKSTDISMRK